MTDCRFYGGDLVDAYEYLDTTSKHFLLPTAGIGSLAERGAAWLFVRYMVDHYAAGTARADWDTLTRSLVGTAQTGAQNIAAVTRDPVPTVGSPGGPPNYLTQGVRGPPELQYVSLNLQPGLSS